ncbi:MAG: FAD-dependent monooxygenase [Labrys sp. (in: a-proteobacteria)]
MRVAIVGAGIGGLTTAIALARRGLEPRLIERSLVLEEVGAGIQLSPNAVRVLEALGLREAMAESMVEARAIHIRRGQDGREILALPLADARQRWGAPYATIRRADLQSLLVDAVRAARLPLDLGHALVADECRLPATDEAPRLVLDTPAGRMEAEADVVIGADGLWSSVRRAMGQTSAPVFQRKRAHRAILPIADLPRDIDPTVTGLWLGEDAHLVHYPVSSGRAVNIVAVVRDEDAAQGWSRPSADGEVAGAFARWTRPMRDLIAAAPGFQSWPLHDRPPDRAWTRGRTALLGDAAHPMVPFLAQGGAMAIEDAAVLAARLTETSAPLPVRLARYAADRQPRTARVQTEARANGDRYHWGTARSAARDLGLTLLGAQRMLARYDWLYRWCPP